jgi:hypothetical protein
LITFLSRSDFSRLLPFTFDRALKRHWKLLPAYISIGLQLEFLSRQNFAYFFEGPSGTPILWWNLHIELFKYVKLLIKLLFYLSRICLSIFFSWILRSHSYGKKFEAVVKYCNSQEAKAQTSPLPIVFNINIIKLHTLI